MDAGCVPDRETEKKRYQLHNNTLSNTGYRTYLESFWNAVSAHAHALGLATGKVFDFGCGPVPALVMLLEEKGIQCRGWDPLFSADTPFFEGGADIVTCLEVAEHFYDPEEGFAGLYESVRPGGLCAIGTRTLPSENTDNREYFRSWWYRQDITHVAFYTKDALCQLASRAGFRWSGCSGPHIHFFVRE